MTGTVVRRYRGLAYAAAFTVLTLGAMAILILLAVDAGFTQPFTRMLVAICAWLMNIFGADVRANGVVLSFATGAGAVMVASGCNAVEVCILFAAAIAPFPAPVAARAAGVIVGVAAIQALNLLRIISLLLLSRFAANVFDFFHLFVWDAFIMLDGVALFLAWNQWQAKRWPARAKLESEKAQA
jgi:exosortase H (IPTLxxWG-CTERM-specific)